MHPARCAVATCFRGREARWTRSGQGICCPGAGLMAVWSEHARRNAGLTLVGGIEDVVSPVLHLRLTKPAADADAAETTLQVALPVLRHTVGHHMSHSDWFTPRGVRDCRAPYRSYRQMQTSPFVRFPWRVMPGRPHCILRCSICAPAAVPGSAFLRRRADRARSTTCVRSRRWLGCTPQPITTQ